MPLERLIATSPAEVGIDEAAMEALFAHCREVRREHDAVLNPLPQPDEDEG